MRVSALEVILLLSLLGAVAPAPKDDGVPLSRPKVKRAMPAADRKDEHPHPTVPRSRLHAAAASPAAPGVPARPSVLKAAAAAERASEAAPATKKGASSASAAPAEEGELSSSERAALIGGLLLAPAGIGGFLLGCSIGGGSVLLYEKVSKGVQSALADYKAKNKLEIEGGFRSFEQYAQLNEITVKAPSEELAELYKQRLTALLQLPHNRRCFDCTHVEEDMAVWASINLGVFVCGRCAGMHRALGTHKSRIKSAYADVWTLEMIERMEGLGNAKALQIYGQAGGVRVGEEVSADVLEAHVRDKYSKVKPAPGPLPSASGKLYRCEPLPQQEEPSVSTLAAPGAPAQQSGQAPTTASRSAARAASGLAGAAGATAPASPGLSGGRPALKKKRRKSSSASKRSNSTATPSSKVKSGAKGASSSFASSSASKLTSGSAKKTVGSASAHVAR